MMASQPVFYFCIMHDRESMARETATALRETNEDGPAKMVSLQKRCA